MNQNGVELNIEVDFEKPFDEIKLALGIVPTIFEIFFKMRVLGGNVETMGCVNSFVLVLV